MDMIGILDPDPHENLCGSETLVDTLDSAVGLHTGELDSSVGCAPRSQTDSKTSFLGVFVLATSFDSIFLKNF